MNEDFLQKLDLALQEETIAYEKMTKLYEEKKDILIKREMDNLMKIDDKIIENLNLIKSLDKKRLELLSTKNIENLSLDEMIEEAKKIKSPLEQVFEAHKVKLRELSRELMLLETTNVELIKHGLVISEKVLNIITSALTPQNEGYDKKGKTVEHNDLGISSIIEEA